MMHWVWIILIGFLAGFVARLVTPGSGPSGFILTAVLGIAGSVVASFVGQQMGWYAAGNIAGFIASVIGAVVLLVLYHLAFRGR